MSRFATADGSARRWRITGTARSSPSREAPCPAPQRFEKARRRNNKCGELPRRTVAIFGACLAVAVGVIAGATASIARHAASVQVCVLLPDTKSSVRWVQFDAPDFADGLQEGRRHGFDQQRAQRPDQAEGTGSGMPGRRREGRHRDGARQRLCSRDREAVHERRRVRDRLRPPGARRQRLRLRHLRRQGRRRGAGQRRHRRR